MNGYGYGQSGLHYGMSDIWLFNSTSLQWKAIVGTDNSAGVYGTKNVTTQNSLPANRQYGTYSIISSGKYLILFGGKFVDYTTYSSSHFNDVWYITLGSYTTDATLTSTLPKSAITSSLSKSAAVTTANMARNSLSSPMTRLVITRSPPIPSNNSPEYNPIVRDFNWQIIVFASCVFLALTIIATIFGYYRCCRNQNRKKNTENTEFSSTNDLITNDTTTKTFTEFDQATVTSKMTVSHTENDHKTALQTMTAGQTEIAVPGFLKYTDENDFKILKRIAFGGGGDIFLANALVPNLMEFGKTIVVKVVSKHRNSTSTLQVQAFEQEVAVMYYLSRQKNIAGILGWCEEPTALLMKHYLLGALKEFINNGKVNTKQLKFAFCLDISRGLQFMHSKQVAHCDIKPANVLVDQDQDGRLFCALTDFGISQMYSDAAQLVGGFKIVDLRGASVAYAAPDVLVRLKFGVPATLALSLASDIYSFGVVICALIKGTDGWK